jgi:hypothetical protein
VTAPEPASASAILRARAVWLAPPVLAGAALRLWNLGPQILGGDEIHAVRAALLEPLPAILTTYSPADPCLPLAALDRALLSVGVPLSEPVLRAPALLAGLALLVWAPLAVEGRLGARAAAFLAWLLALSPVLVLYSRIARPYLPIVLLGSLAAAAFLRCWERPSWRAGAAYVLAAALAVWLHLVALPFVAAPFLFALGDLALHPRARARRGESRAGLARRLCPLALLAVAEAAACAAFLLPARRSLLALVAHKRAPAPVPWRTIGEVLLLQAGTARPAVALSLWLAAAAGLALLVRGRRRDRRLAAYTLTLAAGQAAGLAILAPVGLFIPIVLDRYLILVLPLVLLWTAVALAGLPDLAATAVAAVSGRGAAAVAAVSDHTATAVAAASDRPATAVAVSDRPATAVVAPDRAATAVADVSDRAATAVANFSDQAATAVAAFATRAGLVAGAIFLAVVFAAGPFADPRFRGSSFMHHDDFVDFAAARSRLPAVPAFYRWLANAPAAPEDGGGAVVEFPWVPLWTNNAVFYVDQEVHRRRVLVASPFRRLYSPGIAFSNLIPPTPAGLCASGARFVSVHLHVAHEQDMVEPSEPFKVEPIERPLRRALREAGEDLARRLAAVWGAPVYRDGAIAVWDLGKVCPRRAVGAG